jgi:hypothetical protein
MCGAENYRNRSSFGLKLCKHKSQATDRRLLTQRRRKKLPGFESLSKVFLYLNLLFAFTVFVRAETDLDEDADFEPPSTSNVDGTTLTDDVVLHSLHFTSSSYSATIPENSVGKVYVVPENVRMGIVCNDSSVNIRYRIKSGDQVSVLQNFFVHPSLTLRLNKLECLSATSLSG